MPCPQLHNQSFHIRTGKSFYNLNGHTNRGHAMQVYISMVSFLYNKEENDDKISTKHKQMKRIMGKKRKEKKRPTFYRSYLR